MSTNMPSMPELAPLLDLGQPRRTSFADIVRDYEIWESNTPDFEGAWIANHDAWPAAAYQALGTDCTITVAGESRPIPRGEIVWVLYDDLGLGDAPFAVFLPHFRRN